MLSLISPMILIAIGLGLIALEALTFSFILFWFGLSFMIIGIFSYFPLFPDGLWQLSSIAIVAIALLLTLRTKAIKIFMKAKEKENNDNFLNEKGIGIIKDGKVHYKATYWDIDLAHKDTFEEDEKVLVSGTKHGIADISKI